MMVNSIKYVINKAQKTLETFELSSLWTTHNELPSQCQRKCILCKARRRFMRPISQKPSEIETHCLQLCKQIPNMMDNTEKRKNLTPTVGNSKVMLIDQKFVVNKTNLPVVEKIVKQKTIEFLNVQKIC
uniref:Uncharacterized protein n=1 Tax=Romanomermis culicivorax TaxID=13658 RepID=A0A915HQV3_ROMCU